MSDRLSCQQLVQSFVEFLRTELAAGDRALETESAESVEVAVQCLETAYYLPPTQTTQVDLLNVFREAKAAEQMSNASSAAPRLDSAQTPATDEDKKQAELLKGDGNINMKDENFPEAVQCYTKAIEKDPNNAVYYCNRAAANSKLNSHHEAIKDCQTALDLDPNYSKACGRMGLAYSALEQYKETRDCYRRALDLEPDNEGYARNLAIAEEKLSVAVPQQPANPLAGLLSGGGGMAGLSGAFSSGGSPDLSGLLANPALMNMATQLMSDPNMQNMMTNILGGAAAGGAGPTAPAPPPPAPVAAPAPPAPAPAGGAVEGAEPQPDGFPGIESLLTAGRQLAEQMQSQHPELLQQLRSQMGGPQPPQPPPQP